MVPEPVALAFANTRSSSRRDRIATLADWRTWIGGWPGLAPAGRQVDADGLIGLRRQRDDIQSLLHSAAGGELPDPAALEGIARLARSESSTAVRWSSGRPVLFVATDASPSAAIAQHMARATLEALLTGPPLRRCAGRSCAKVFIAARADRRWCDSAVCGNRARVRAHSERQREQDRSDTGRRG